MEPEFKNNMLVEFGRGGVYALRVRGFWQFLKNMTFSELNYYVFEKVCDLIDNNPLNVFDENDDCLKIRFEDDWFKLKISAEDWETKIRHMSSDELYDYISNEKYQYEYEMDHDDWLEQMKEVNAFWRSECPEAYY